MTLFIFVFLSFFSWHTFTYVNITRCSTLQDTNCSKAFGNSLTICTNEENSTSSPDIVCPEITCQNKYWTPTDEKTRYHIADFSKIKDCLSKKDQGLGGHYYASLYGTWTTTILYLILEFQEFVKKLWKERSFFAYFTYQNLVEDLILLGTIVFPRLTSWRYF